MSSISYAAAAALGLPKNNSHNNNDSSCQKLPTTPFKTADQKTIERRSIQHRATPTDNMTHGPAAQQTPYKRQSQGNGHPSHTQPSNTQSTAGNSGNTKREITCSKKGTSRQTAAKSTHPTWDYKDWKNSSKQFSDMKPKEAIPILQGLIKRPDNKERYLLRNTLAVILANNGQRDEAMSLLRTRTNQLENKQQCDKEDLRLSKTDIDCIIILSRLYDKANNPEQALQVLQPYADHINHMLSSENLHDGSTNLRKSLSNYAQTYANMLATTGQKEPENFKQASIWLEKMRTHFGDRKELASIELYITQHKGIPALMKKYQELKVKLPNNSDSTLQVSSFLECAGKYDIAAEILEEWKKTHQKTDQRIFQTLCVVYTKLEKWDEACAIAQEISKKWPNNPSVLVTASSACYNAWLRNKNPGDHSQYQQAIEYMQQALDITTAAALKEIRATVLRHIAHLLNAALKIPNKNPDLGYGKPLVKELYRQANSLCPHAKEKDAFDPHRDFHDLEIIEPQAKGTLPDETTQLLTQLLNQLPKEIKQKNCKVQDRRDQTHTHRTDSDYSSRDSRHNHTSYDPRGRGRDDGTHHSSREGSHHPDGSRGDSTHHSSRDDRTHSTRDSYHHPYKQDTGPSTSRKRQAPDFYGHSAKRARPDR